MIGLGLRALEGGGNFSLLKMQAISSLTHWNWQKNINNNTRNIGASHRVKWGEIPIKRTPDTSRSPGEWVMAENHSAILHCMVESQQGNQGRQTKKWGGGSRDVGSVGFFCWRGRGKETPEKCSAENLTGKWSNENFFSGRVKSWGGGMHVSPFRFWIAKRKNETRQVPESAWTRRRPAGDWKTAVSPRGTPPPRDTRTRKTKTRGPGRTQRQPPGWSRPHRGQRSTVWALGRSIEFQLFEFGWRSMFF